MTLRSLERIALGENFSTGNPPGSILDALRIKNCLKSVENGKVEHGKMNSKKSFDQTRIEFFF